MKTNTLKNLGIFAPSIVLNGYFLYHAVQANRRHNEYFANISPEEQLKMKAMHAYLLKTAPLYGCNIPIGDNAALINYKYKSDKEKQDILLWYTKTISAQEQEENIRLTRDRFHAAMKKP